MELKEFFENHRNVALAFSGGVDSGYLLWAAKQYCSQIRAYYVKTAFQPQFEYDDARLLAEALGVEMTTIALDVLSDEAIASNPSNRCYFCKHRIFSAIAQSAEADGFSCIIDGTNASDDISGRPGIRALMELGIHSPLWECGLTKEDIRQRSKAAGLFTHDKPAYACLATRIPTGNRITAEALEKTENCENFMRKLGFSDFRIRMMGEYAKIQLPESQLPLLLNHREEIISKFKKYYSSVLLDLEVRHES